MLEIGTKAPDFTLADQNGDMHSLSNYRGQKPAALSRPVRLEICIRSSGRRALLFLA